MSWCVTSPWGPQFISWWSCYSCTAGRSPGDQGADEIRGEAAAHVARAGHQVSVYRGTDELLLPLNTAAPRKELTP